MIRRLIGLQTRDLIANTDTTIKASGAETAIDIQNLDHNVVAWSPQLTAENHQLRIFLRENLYQHPRVKRLSARTDTIICDLYNTYMMYPNRLPTNITGEDQKRSIQRTVCDYVAGMTDRFALGEHSTLIESGNIIT
jgi:dGTPase